MFSSALDFVCDYCSRSFTRKYNLQVHIENCHINSSNACNVCGQTFGSSVGLHSHYERGHNSHGEPHPECDVCGRIFTRKQNVISHMITMHTRGPEPENRCKVCSKVFSSERNLRRHMTQVHHMTMTDVNDNTCDECQRVFKTKSALIAHVAVHTTVSTSKEVKCYLCDREYCNPRNLKRHVETHHGEKEEFRCDICPKVYPSNQSLRRHIRSNHNVDDQDEYTCEHCNKVILGQVNLFSHVHNFHRDNKDVGDSNDFDTSEAKTKVLNCGECGSRFDDESLLRQHVKTEHSFEAFYEYCKNYLLQQEAKSKTNKDFKENNFFTCEFCNAAFDSLYDLKNHMSVNHDCKYYVSRCNVCFNKFCSKESMLHHKEICRSPPKVNSCSHCDKLFTEKCSLEFHIKIFHPQAQIADSNITSTNHEDSDDSMFRCSYCDRAYYSDRSLKHHMKLKHTTNEEVECEVCGKICSNKYYHASHMKLVHSEEFSSKCDYCEKQFKSKRNIRRHIEFTHLGRQRYRCIECESMFKENRSLRKHVRIKHPNSSLFPQCHICRKRFESAKSCKIHLKLSHSFIVKTRPCHLCSASFTSQYDLDTHLRTKHLTKDDTYKCQKCNAVYQGKENLMRHNKVYHATVAPILKNKPLPRCIICSKDFSTRKTLKRHIKKFHGQFNVQELANYGSQRREFKFDCESCVKNFRDDHYFDVYQNMKKDSNAVIFSCEVCSKSFTAPEYSIQRYMLTSHELAPVARSKLVLSELCTAEMSDDESYISEFGMLQKMMEPESTTSDVKYDLYSQMPIANSQKDSSEPEFQGFESTVKTEEATVKTEPMSP